MSQHAPKNDRDTSTKTAAILSLNRALLGEIAPTLRAARISDEKKVIHLFFYYDGEISEEDNESAECVATEVISDYPEHELELDIIRLDYPNSIPQVGELVYLRKEKSPITTYPNANSLRVSILLAAIDALHRRVSPSLRAAQFFFDAQCITLLFYYQDPISTEDRLLAEAIGAEVSLHFGQYEVKVEILQWDHPRPIPQEHESFYRRREL